MHSQAREMVARAAVEGSVTDPGFDIGASREAARASAALAPREAVAEVGDLMANAVPVRRYRPEGWSTGDGVVVHLHGGGFVFHDVDVHDAAARRLANRSGMVVLSVDYRRPPEHPFPAAPDDASAVITWIKDQPDLDGPTFVHGDSAGGNLALVTALRHPGVFRGLVLVYPFLDPSMASASYRTEENAALNRQEAAWYWQQYGGDPNDPDLAPLLSSGLHELPPTLILSAECDVLRDEAESLAARLDELGVEVVASRYLGMVHGFWRAYDSIDAAEMAYAQVGVWLRAHA